MFHFESLWFFAEGNYEIYFYQTQCSRLSMLCGHELYLLYANIGFGSNGFHIYRGQFKNNEANVLQNGPKIINLSCISASWVHVFHDLISLQRSYGWLQFLQDIPFFSSPCVASPPQWPPFYFFSVNILFLEMVKVCTVWNVPRDAWVQRSVPVATGQVRTYPCLSTSLEDSWHCTECNMWIYAKQMLVFST